MIECSSLISNSAVLCCVTEGRFNFEGSFSTQSLLSQKGFGGRKRGRARRCVASFPKSFFLGDSQRKRGSLIVAVGFLLFCFVFFVSKCKVLTQRGNVMRDGYLFFFFFVSFSLRVRFCFTKIQR